MQRESGFNYLNELELRDYSREAPVLAIYPYCGNLIYKTIPLLWQLILSSLTATQLFRVHANQMDLKVWD